MAKVIFLAAPPTYRGTDSYEHLFYLVAHCFPNNSIVEEPGDYDLLILVADEDGSIDLETHNQAIAAHEGGKLVQMATINRKKKLSLIVWDELIFEPFDSFVRVSQRKLSPV